jgi:hypothetical protein
MKASSGSEVAMELRVDLASRPASVALADPDDFDRLAVLVASVDAEGGVRADVEWGEGAA